MLFLYSCWSFIEHAKRELEVIDYAIAIEINEKEGVRSISTWNLTTKGLDPAEDGLGLLVFAPTNLQIFSIFDNITPSSWKGRRRRSGSNDLTTKSSDNGYGSPNSLARSLPKLTPSHLNALGISLCSVVCRTLPYLGSAVGHCSEVPSRFCHYCWPLCPEQRWCRAPMGCPPFWNCGGQWMGYRNLEWSKATLHGRFSNFNIPKNHLKMLQNTQISWPYPQIPWFCRSGLGPGICTFYKHSRSFWCRPSTIHAKLTKWFPWFLPLLPAIVDTLPSKISNLLPKTVTDEDTKAVKESVNWLS